ncbi:putative transcription factor Homeodomain-TALE-KNOX family [Helianthus annuus]|nr:putative transcription factor Homeodomain-TALE-KNOX family [Helianthus annuus]
MLLFQRTEGVIICGVPFKAFSTQNKGILLCFKFLLSSCCGTPVSLALNNPFSITSSRISDIITLCPMCLMYFWVKTSVCKATGGCAGFYSNEFLLAHYVILLSSFKEQLQQHVRVHAMEAVMACWELEKSLQSLTDSMGFGLPTDSERSLMERVRQELKHVLKQGYKEKIVDIREEIPRKRRAGKLPGDTTSLLKAWWQSHSKWPYPTEEDKARLVQETGLQLKQINNWFINQRKRNWHSNPSSSTSVKSKRKR